MKRVSHTPFSRFGRRFAVKLGDFERSVIDTSLNYDELKQAFHMMDTNGGKLYLILIL